jgi:drug/metabolite transporter (DMT)-like permease
VRAFEAPQWAGALYLGAFAGALGFYLWVFALERASPTRVANTITVSPIAAAILGAALLTEPIGASLLVGIAAVALGIWISASR